MTAHHACSCGCLLFFYLLPEYRLQRCSPVGNHMAFRDFVFGQCELLCNEPPVQLEPGRYHHPTRAARAGTPVRFRFCIFRPT